MTKILNLKSYEKSSLMDALIAVSLYSNEEDKVIISYKKFANKFLQEACVINSKRDLLLGIKALYFTIIFYSESESKFNMRRVAKYKKTLETLTLAKYVVFSHTA